MILENSVLICFLNIHEILSGIGVELEHLVTMDLTGKLEVGNDLDIITIPDGFTYEKISSLGGIC